MSIDYFADGEWTDRAPLLVQTLLLESLENSRSINAIDRESVGLRADFILKSEIRHFEAVYDSPNGPPENVGPHGHPDLDLDGVHHHETRAAPVLRPQVRAPLDRREGGT